MEMAEALQTYLRQRNIPFEIFSCGPGGRPADVAEALGFALDQIARPILLSDRTGVLMAVIPAGRRLDLKEVRRQLARPELALAPTDAIARALIQCDPASAPPFAELFGLETVVEEAFAAMDGIYFAACQAGTLVRIQSDSFQRLHAASEWGQIATSAPLLRGPSRSMRPRLPKRLTGRFYIPRPSAQHRNS